MDSRNDNRTDQSIGDWRGALRDSIVQEVARGCSEEEAARRNGIHPQTHWRWRKGDCEYNSRSEAARAESIRRIKATVLASMRKGMDFGESSEIAGRVPGTLRAWRRQGSVFDAKVRAFLKKQRKACARKRAQEKRSGTKD